MVLTRKKLPRSKLPTWSHPPIYAAVRAATAAAQLFPFDETVRVMRGMAGGFASLPFNRTRLRRATDNLSWCFPDWSAEKVHEHAIEAYRHLFTVAAEIAYTPRLISSDSYPNHVELGTLAEGLRELLTDRPAILIAGHCGNWELLGTTLAVLGLPVHALYRPLDMRPLDNWVQDSRSRRGLTLVNKFGASHVLPDVLTRREPVGFIADQNAGERGLYVPFFGRLASTYKSIALLAIRFNASLVCGMARRLTPAERALSASHGDGHDGSSAFSYHIDIIDVIRPEDWQGGGPARTDAHGVPLVSSSPPPDPIYYITARYRRAIETMVRRAPDQYLWMHRYWKTRPPHERDGKPFPPRLRQKLLELPWMTADELDRITDRSARDAEEIRQHGKLRH
ncbi:MAG TPA: lysophospholipid acyltransferase family protein [Phycisphaerales bacterium]|nr:lysophospholipid acyltransferase family protein [Phycisphaerales bacterium]